MPTGQSPHQMAGRLADPEERNMQKAPRSMLLHAPAPALHLTEKASGSIMRIKPKRVCLLVG